MQHHWLPERIKPRRSLSPGFLEAMVSSALLNSPRYRRRTGGGEGRDGGKASSQGRRLSCGIFTFHKNKTEMGGEVV